MRFTCAIRSVCLATSAIAICGVANAEPKKPEVKVETRLLFSHPIPGFEDQQGKTFEDEFLWSGLEAFRTPDRNAALKRECIDPPTEPVFFGAILGFLIGPAISLLTDTVKSSLDDELKKYTREFKASEQSPFYEATAAGRKQSWRCFRITRVSTTKPTKPGDPVVRTLDFDLIAQVQVVGGNNAMTNLGPNFENAYGIKIRPLRIFLAKPLAKGSRIGMSSTVSFDAAWREGGVGKQQTLFSAPLVERKFVRDRSGRWMHEPYYFPATKTDGTEDPDPSKFPGWESFPLQPLVPFSSAGAGGSFVTVTTSFTEVGDGDGKGALKFISGLFGKSQSDLNTLVTKAAKKLIEPDAPTPPAKPELFCGTIAPNGQGGASIQWTKTDAAGCPAS